MSSDQLGYVTFFAGLALVVAALALLFSPLMTEGNPVLAQAPQGIAALVVEDLQWLTGR